MVATIGNCHYIYLMQLPSADILSLVNPAWMDVDDPFHYSDRNCPL